MSLLTEMEGGQGIIWYKVVVDAYKMTLKQIHLYAFVLIILVWVAGSLAYV